MTMDMNTTVNMTSRVYMIDNELRDIPIPGIEGKYKITKEGNLYSVSSNMFVKGRINRSGYLTYNIWFSGKCKGYSIHRLVAISFIPNPDNLPIVHHKDGNRLNNNKDNLEWTTNKGNIDAYILTTGKRGVSKCPDRELYESRLRFNGKKLHLGRFTTQEAAYEAYRLKYIELYGKEPW